MLRTVAGRVLAPAARTLGSRPAALRTAAFSALPRLSSTPMSVMLQQPLRSAVGSVRALHASAPWNAATAVDLDSNSFDKEVLQAKGLVLVDFHAVWCGPCKVLDPVLKKVVGEYQDDDVPVKLAKLDIDQSMELAQQFQISSVPCVYFFHQGKVVGGFVGALPERDVREYVDSAIAKTGIIE